MRLNCNYGTDIRKENR